MKNNRSPIAIPFSILAKITLLMLAFTALGMVTAKAQPLFWNNNGVAGNWTNNPNWSFSSSGPFTTVYVANTDVEFTTNSTLTFGTVSIGNVTVDSNQVVTVTKGGTITFGASGTDGLIRTFYIGSGAVLTWSGQPVTANSTAGITKNGAGTLNLGAWTFTTAMNGGFTLNAGTVIVSGAKALGSGAVTINGGTLQSSGGNTFSVTGLNIGGNFTLAGTGNDIWAAPISLGSVTPNITNSTSSGSRLFGGLISGSPGVGVAFWGGTTNGTINLTNAGNTFTGPININGAEVVFQNDGSFGAVPGAVTTNAIVIDGGRLTAADGSNNAVIYTLNPNRGIQVGATPGTAISVGKTNGLLAYFGVIADKTGSTGILVKQGAGIFSVGGTNTYSGGTFVNNGTLQLTNGSNVLPAGTLLNLGQPAPSSNVGIFDLNGNNQQIAGLNSITGTNFATAKNVVTNSAAMVGTLTISNTAVNAYGDGSITNSGIIAGAVNLVKNGSGTQILGDTNTYIGATTVNAGILALSGNGSIGNSSAIALAAGAIMDVSARTDNTLTLNSGQTLSGFGTVTGNAASGGSSTIEPGNPTTTGILAVSGNATLNGTNLLKLYKTGETNDVLSVGGILAYGGILTVANLSGTLGAGDSFKLFNAASYQGSFSATNLPVLTAGLSWTNTLGINGTLSVVGSSSPAISSLAITNFSLLATNIVIGGTNQGAGNSYVLATTNLALPMANWTVVATNVLGGSGSFTLTITNAASPSIPHEFYILSTTNNL